MSTSTEGYSIDENVKIVNFNDGSYCTFDYMGDQSRWNHSWSLIERKLLAEGGDQYLIDFLVARDELIDRGFINDV